MGIYRTNCEEMMFPYDGKILVRAKNCKKGYGAENLQMANEVMEFEADLLVGCDGINSVVRTSLANYHALDNKSKDDFGLVTLPSDSAGLRYKMPPLQPKFVLKKNAANEKYLR